MARCSTLDNQKINHGDQNDEMEEYRRRVHAVNTRITSCTELLWTSYHATRGSQLGAAPWYAAEHAVIFQVERRSGQGSGL